MSGRSESHREWVESPDSHAKLSSTTLVSPQLVLIFSVNSSAERLSISATMDLPLIAKIHALPPEIFNQIRSETIPTHIGTKVEDWIHLTASFQLPVQLRLNRGIRYDFIHSYHYFDRRTFVSTSWDLLGKFVEAVCYIPELRGSRLTHKGAVQGALSFRKVSLGAFSNEEQNKFISIANSIANFTRYCDIHSVTVNSSRWKDKQLLNALAADGIVMTDGENLTVWELVW